MSPLLLYLIKSTLSLAILYLCYSLILKKESIFKFNRIYLLISLLIASLLPLLNFNIFEIFLSNNSKSPEYLITYQLSEIILEEVVVNGSSTNNWFSVILVLTLVYFAGVVFKLLQFIYRLGQLLHFARKNKSFKSNGSIIIISEKDIPTFSFFNLIFINELTFKNKGIESIIKHEKIHISHWHSIDLLLAEIVTIIFWFNPFVYLLKKSIKDNHEFIADQEVVKSNRNYSAYKLLLMEQASSIRTNVLAHNFSYSLLKRRLNMINKPKRPLNIGIGLFSAIVALGFVLFACSTAADKEQITKIEEPQIELIEDVFTVVEVMPEYPGGMDSLGAFLGRNIKYPKSAKDEGIQGTVFVNFIVEKDGSVGRVKTIRGISDDCDEEAVRVVSLMPDWTPGKQKGQEVRVSFNLPIKFQLDDDKTKKGVTRVHVIDDSNSDSVFQVVDHMPEYPGGFEAMSTFLAKNIKYPEQAKKDKVTGRVFVSFIVEKDGSVSNVKLLRGIGGGCDEEALRVVMSMPTWNPGLDDDGNAVRVQYNLPIKFALS